VQFEERRRVAARPLAGNEIRIGRDPTCDLIVDYANVSRQHAVVRPLGDRSVVLDLGSTNGVRVNGAEIGGKPHLLAPGDVIELTDQVVLLYEEGPFASSTPWVVTAVATLVLLAAAIGLYIAARSEPATGAAQHSRASRKNPGPESPAAGTYLGMPSVRSEETGSSADARAPRLGWYAQDPRLAARGHEGDPG
jgi:hypothetical protein